MGYYRDWLYENAITWTTDGANAGTVCYRSGKFYCTNVCGVLLSNQVKANKMIAEALNKVAKKYVSYVGNPKLMNNVMAEIDVSIPLNIHEQDKISNLFNNLDTLISLTQQKLSQLKTIKKACLEKMFPKDGETVPEVRFQGFEGPWERMKLGEIADIVGGGTPSTNIPEYWGGHINWYSPAEIGNEVFVSESQRKITQEGYNHCSATILPPGSVLFTSRAGIGKTAILKKEGCTNQGFQSIVPNKGKLDSYFIYSCSGYLKQYGETVGAGSTFVEVSGKQMANMDILIPSIVEQKDIGSYFCNLDNQIFLHQQKLDKLKNLKKALLDKMFV